MGEHETIKFNSKMSALGITRVEALLRTDSIMGSRWYTAAYYAHASVPIVEDNWPDLTISLRSLLEKAERKLK